MLREQETEFFIDIMGIRHSRIDLLALAVLMQHNVYTVAYKILVIYRWENPFNVMPQLMSYKFCKPRSYGCKSYFKLDFFWNVYVCLSILWHVDWFHAISCNLLHMKINRRMVNKLDNQTSYQAYALFKLLLVNLICIGSVKYQHIVYCNCKVL